MKNNPQTFINAPQEGDFEAIVGLLELLGAAQRKIDRLSSAVEQSFSDRVARERSEYSMLSATITDTEGQIEEIGRRNPQWFKEEKTVKTPFGTIKFTEVTEIVAPSEEASIRLIIAAKEETQYVRTKLELDRDALKKADDATLAKFGLLRNVRQSAKISTKVVDLGKAVAAAEKTEKASATKAAKKERAS